MPAGLPAHLPLGWRSFLTTSSIYQRPVANWYRIHCKGRRVCRGVTQVEFMILGPTRLIVEGRQIDLGPAKQRGLLALLLYNVNKPVPVEVIGSQLWPAQAAQKLRQSLYSPVSRIRRAFAESGVSAKLIRVGDAYSLTTDPELIDYNRFVGRMKSARAAAAKGDHSAVVDALQEAVDWWTGAPLEELKSADAEQIRELMINVWGLLPAYHLLFDSLLALGQHREVLSQLAPLLEKHPYDEVLAKQWIVALAATGRRHDVTRQYNRLRQRLDDTGEEQLDELQAAYRRVLGNQEIRETRAEFVPPRQLLRDTREFTGHADLIAELDAMIDEPGSPAGVALTGMPGIGKTTLVTHWAHHRRDRFPDGELYINMNGYGSGRPIPPDEVLARFLHALGLPVDRIPAAGESRRARLGQLLADRRVLIVLDNVRNADHLRPLLSALSASLVLITSRDRLKGLTVRDGFRSIPVPTLSTAESVTLLRTLIGARRAAEAPSAVTSLARLSSGLPLALWIMGQHIAERPLANLDELPDQLRAQLLREPDDDEEESTLHTVFSWSYEDLPATTARLFRLLGLHPGHGVSAEVAGALFGERPERHLDKLIRLHLIEHDTAQRYRMHDLLHMFAAARSELDDSDEERSAAVHRMLTFYLLTGTNAAHRLAPQRSPVPGLPKPDGFRPIDFSTDAAAMAWCELERQNLTAMPQCAAKYGFHKISWQLPGAMHEVFERYGPQEDILRSNEIGLSSAQAIGDYEGQIGTLNNLGATCLDIGALQDAKNYFQEGLRLAQEAGHREGQAVCLQNLGNVHSELGSIGTAIRHFQLARKAYHDIREFNGEAFSLHRLGLAHHQMEKDDEALRHLTRALTIRVQIGHKRGEGATRTALARVYLGLEELDTARDHGRRALTALLSTMDQSMTCEALITLAEVQHASGAFDETIDLARQATEISTDEIISSQARARALDILGRALDIIGDHQAARVAWTEELEILTDLDSPKSADIQDRLTNARGGTQSAPPQRSDKQSQPTFDIPPKG
ncbi:DNA-binding SARP family transcriptional activator [Kibdelosporangium banguiense]|uniref:DNA-binding SARP family transcriptional activator n=1 Tax=Kibdelosporangium banguiense TaxID=1365924 RepID=A0ABS4T6R3_9PSEU|nr:tetratricopeptide repeat protein [Kibdelosporangium banguiense]MBP2320116.1 DNA-binding SARP family transcriptional activator [Kibdelosporangium banguiense]